MTLRHGTAVALRDACVLLLGPPGSGKSDLALRLVTSGWTLVADDQVELSGDGSAVTARPPSALAGLLEVRGLGIVRVDHAPACPVRLVARLGGSPPERLPEDAPVEDLAGVPVPLIALDPFQASAPARLALALACALDPTRRVA